MMKFPFARPFACALATLIIPTAVFAQIPANMISSTGETVYSYQSHDIDNTNGGSGLLTLTPMHNGVVKVDEAGNAAYSDVKALGRGSAQTGAGAGTGAGIGTAVGNLQPDGTIQVIPEGRVVAYYNFFAGVLAAGPSHPKTGDMWTVEVDFTQSTGQALAHLHVTAKVTMAKASGTIVSFDGSSDDKLAAGRVLFGAIKMREQTHLFGSMNIAKGTFETAQGETDTTLARSTGHNEIWTFKRA